MRGLGVVVACDRESSSSSDAVVVGAGTFFVSNEELTIALFADLTFPVGTRVAVGGRVERHVADYETICDTCQSAVDVVNYRLAISVVISEPVLT